MQAAYIIHVHHVQAEQALQVKIGALTIADFEVPQNRVVGLCT